MISQTAEYALRAIVFLANQGGEARTTATIAKGTQVPAGYLAKVMQSLSRHGLVHSQRGLHGGFTLCRSPEELTVLEVINAVDPIRRYPECPLGLPNHGKRMCPLHRQLDDAGQHLETLFGAMTIAKMNDAPASRRPLCRFPAEPAET